MHITLNKKHKKSSQKWLTRQINDPYVKHAKQSGYLCRSAFKLKEINDKFKLLNQDSKVIDLGSCPGGWLQVIKEYVTNGIIIGVDINYFDPLPGVYCLQGNFLLTETQEKIITTLNNNKEKSDNKADAVISDMAAPATGNKLTDHLRTMTLAECAWDFCKSITKSNGFFLCKILQGCDSNTLLQDIKQNSKLVKHIKPQSSRKDSREIYLLAQLK